ncbi:CreA family protein [Variovorax dokdonensis]|uniref:CreA family protein n=1 Tax=Variovorax dokdonensis TaxID=344883 RepID=A0ABT7NA08_9BURK|nr:CreA family protein [Variovorax dokdonensis]MDM0044764.1 CreA family protein [Variovorax dokdonensis]
MHARTIRLASLAVALLACAGARAERVGEVDTAFKLIGPDHKVVVDVYDDPKVKGVSCYVSRAVTGGVSGALGLAEDKAEAAIACKQVGAVSIAAPLPKQEEVFSERQSILFKRLRVVRMVDAKRHTLVYLTYSDKLVEGSPENAVAAVPLDASVALTVKP